MTAKENSRIREELVEKFFAEAYESMMKIADDLEGEWCYCEICPKG